MSTKSIKPMGVMELAEQRERLNSAAPEMFEALREFIDTINSTGGLTVDEKGNEVPVADEEWIDLASAYRRAEAIIAKATTTKGENDK